MSDPDPRAQPLGARLRGVQQGLADAARAAGRDPDELTLIVVTTFHPASLVRELAGLGVADVGENRHQEAQAKAIALINEAAPQNGYLTIKSLEAFEKAADGKATKLIVPSELQSLAGLAASAKEIFSPDAAEQK